MHEDWQEGAVDHLVCPGIHAWLCLFRTMYRPMARSRHGMACLYQIDSNTKDKTGVREPAHPSAVCLRRACLVLALL